MNLSKISATVRQWLSQRWRDFTRDVSKQPPVMLAWSGGVSSTAMLLEWVARGERLDAVVHFGCKPHCAEERALMMAVGDLLAARNIPCFMYTDGAWVQDWKLARRAWDRDCRVVKLVGFDATEMRRCPFAKRHSDKRYELRTPLYDWGWGRAECLERIAAHGLPIPQKTSCLERRIPVLGVGNVVSIRK